MNTKLIDNNEILKNYYIKINELISKSRTNIVININKEMVELYFEISSIINELINKYHLEASQNEIIKFLSKKLINYLYNYCN